MKFSSFVKATVWSVCYISKANIDTSKDVEKNRMLLVSEIAENVLYLQ